MSDFISTLNASEQVQLIFVGYYNRAALSSGFFYWGNEYSTDLSKGMTVTDSLNSIANEFAPQQETLSHYPFLATQNPPHDPSQPGWATWQSNVRSLVDTVFLNLFNRHPAQTGSDYWTQQIASGAVPLGEAILAIANGATGTDVTTLKNKVDAALNFTDQTGAAGLGLTPETVTQSLVSEAGYIIKDVTDDPATVAAAEAATAEFINSGIPNEFVLTTGVDVATANMFVGDLSPFYFNGKGPTLNTGDQLTGTAGKTDNELQIVDSYGQGTDIIPAGITLSNIQKISLQTAGNAGGGSSFDTSPYSSVTSTVVTSSGSGTDVVQASSNSTITVTHNSTRGTVDTFGGSDVSVTTNGDGWGGVSVNVGGKGTGQLETGNVKVNANGSGSGAANINIIGGKDVAVAISQANAAGDVSVGNTAGAKDEVTAAYNPTGTISLTSNSETGAGNVDTIFGGTTVKVAVKGDTVVVGDFAATTPSNQPTGDVTVTDNLKTAFDNLTGTGHNNVQQGGIQVYGGANITVATNTGGGVRVGAAGTDGTYATGDISVTDTSSDQSGAFGQGFGWAGSTSIVGGKNVTVTDAGESVFIGSAAAADNPTGTVSVTETRQSHGVIVIDGGDGVTVNAQGQTVFVGTQAGTAGAQAVDQASVYTGNALGSSNAASSVTVDGGTTVAINTSGGNVRVGSATHAPTGAVIVNDTFSGANGASGDAIAVLGGSTVNVTVANGTSGGITIGQAGVLNGTGTALKNGNLSASGDVTVVNGDEKTTGATTVFTNGAKSVSITGGVAGNITDIETTLSGGSAIGTSTLSSVTLTSTTGTSTITSNALTDLTLASSANGAKIVNTAAHTLSLTLNAGAGVVTDNKAASITIQGTGTGVDAKGLAQSVTLAAAKATSFVFDNSDSVVVGTSTMSTAVTDTDTITAKGAGALKLGNVTAWVGAAQLKSIDASSASGAVTAEINADKTSFKGGSGNDVVTVDVAVGLNGNFKQVVGGDGTDTVYLTNTAAMYNSLLQPTGPISADFTGFEVLGLAAGTKNVGLNGYDVSGFSGVVINDATAFVTRTLTKAAAAETLTFRSEAATDTTNWVLTDATGASDSVSVTIDGTPSTPALTPPAGISVGALNTTNVESVTINSNGASNMTGANAITLSDTGAATKTINVTGDAALNLTDNDGVVTKIVVTDTADVDLSAVKDSAKGVAITGGAGLITVNLDNNNAVTTGNTKDTVTTGAGGGNITLGTGNGLGGNTGQETVNLGASTAVRDTIIANTTPGAAGTGTYGVINNFTVGAVGAHDKSDVLTFQAAQTILANVASVAGASGDTYSVSNGVFTHLSGAANAKTQLADVQGLIDAAGANHVGLFSIGGTSYVVASAGAGGNADTILQLNDVSGVSGFALSAVGGVKTGAGASIDVSNVTLLSKASNGSATTGSFDDTGFAIDTLNVSGGINTYNNLANFGELQVGAVTSGVVTVNQVGASHQLVVQETAAAGGVLDSLTFSGDLIVDAATGALSIKSVVDSANAATTISVTGANAVDLGGITDTALTKIDASQATGAVTLGDKAALSQAGLTVVGGTGALTVTASGTGDHISGDATGFSAGDHITAHGAGDVIAVGSGANVISANGDGDSITVGDLAGALAPIVIGAGQTIHASGAGDTITFASTAADGSAITWAGASIVDGGSPTIGIGNNSTVTFGTNAGGSQMVVLTGDVTGATSSGSYAFTTLKNVADASGDIITLNNATTEVTAGVSLGASQVNVASATTLAQALDLAAATAAMSQGADGKIAAKTGVVDWFQFQGDTYLVEAVNSSSAAATHTALGASDAVVKIVGLVNLDAAHAVTFGGGHTITL